MTKAADPTTAVAPSGHRGMLEATTDSLKKLGLEEHHAIAVAHTDTDHVHVIACCGDTSRSSASSRRGGRLMWIGSRRRLKMPIVEPAAPENVELNVDATQVIIAWNAPSSWLPLRRHQRQVLDSNATDKRPACTETGDDEFCYPAAVTRPAGRTAPEYATSAKRRRQAPQPSGSPGVSPGPG